MIETYINNINYVNLTSKYIEMGEGKNIRVFKPSGYKLMLIEKNKLSFRPKAKRNTIYIVYPEVYTYCKNCKGKNYFRAATFEQENPHSDSYIRTKGLII